jgi:hypothetical protein
MIPDPPPHLFTLNAKSNNAHIFRDLSLMRRFPAVNGVRCAFIPRISGVLISKSLPPESDFLYGYLPRLSVILRNLSVILRSLSVIFRLLLPSESVRVANSSARPGFLRVVTPSVRRPSSVSVLPLRLDRNLPLARITPSTIQVHLDRGIYCPSQPDTGIPSFGRCLERLEAHSPLSSLPRVTQVHLSPLIYSHVQPDTAASRSRSSG